MKQTTNSGPLYGLKIIEFEGIGPAPLAGQLLSDLGADVIKIQKKTSSKKKEPILDRNKKILVLDLKSNDDKALTNKLISKADVLIEGFRPGVMERLGLGPKDCEQINPKLIFGRITGWGQDGPYAKKAGHDINYISITGALNAIGYEETPPVPPLNLLGDYAGGTMFLIMGILSALWERTFSKKGQVIDAAMIEGVPALMSLIHTFCAENNWNNTRSSNLLDGGCPYYRCYKTKDGLFVSVGALENKFFTILIEKLELDQNWIKEQENKSRWDQLSDELAKKFLTKTRNEWARIFFNTDACVEPVLNFTEIEDNLQNKARNIFFRENNTLQANVAPKFSRSVPQDHLNSANPTKTTSQILKEWNID
ncbi:MAG: CaiB/BaiF CoA transferase family protein [Paracoccaceae bacterium]